MFGNVFFRCGEPGQGSFGTVFSHGGRDKLAENNVFIECKRALGSAPWDYARWKDAVKGGEDCFWTGKLLEEVDITKPPYTTRYPELVGYMDPQPDTPRINRAVRNLIVMCADVKSGNWQCDPAGNWVTDQDPGFVDAARGNFALRPDSEVFAKLPGFKPIPFDQIGLYADELRPAPPTEPWTSAPPKPLPPLRRAAAAATPPKGPPPVFTVGRAIGAVTVDGALSPAEWGGLDPAKAMPLAQDVYGAKAQRESLAWLVHDDERLLVSVDNAIAAETLLEGNQWGTNDAVEVSLRPVGDDPAAPIWVFRGYPNGVLAVGSPPSGAQEPVAAEAGGTQFAASRPEPGRWVAEFSIPLTALGLVPSQGTRAAFNITVRKTRGNLWLMWEGTRGHSYDVSSAGIIEFAP